MKILSKIMAIFLTIVLSVGGSLWAAENASVLLISKKDGKPVALLGFLDHRFGTLWSDFGGRPMDEEDPCKTALRELGEECPSYADVTKEDLTKLHKVYRNKENAYHMFVASVTYRVSDSLEAGNEGEIFAWVKLEDLLSIAATKYTKVTAITSLDDSYSMVNEGRDNCNFVGGFLINVDMNRDQIKKIAGLPCRW